MHGSSSSVRSKIARAGVIGLIFGAAGCATNWHDDSKKYLVPYQNGDFKTAAAEAVHCAHEGVPTDEVLFNLDAGATCRAAGNIGESIMRLDHADSLVGNYEQWPDVAIAEETAAALTSARSINYRGKLSDLVMLNTYRALDHMELGHNSGARSMLIRASFVQQDIAQKYADDLKKAEDQSAEDAKKNNDQMNTSKSMQGTDTPQTKEAYKDLLNIKAYGNYVNPFCDYVQGLFFMGAALDQSDKERAATAFKRAASFEPTNPYTVQDVADADKFANGHQLPALTYVIFETGVAPEMGQIQVPLPLFVVNAQAPTVTLYFPTMAINPDYVPSLSVITSTGQFETAVISDMDSVILQEFKNTLNTVITRMVVAAVTKAAIDAGARQGLKSTPVYAQLGYDVVSTVYQQQMNQADLRTWRTLPKQFQVARFETPADHQLLLAPNDLSGRVSVTLEDAPFNVVYVKSVRRGVGLVVRHFALSPNETAPPTPTPPTPPPAAAAAAN